MTVHKESMTPRERVTIALNHGEPDRIPIDLGGFQTGIHRAAYQDLLDYLGFQETIALRDPVQQLAIPSERILELVHADFRYVTAHGPDGFAGGIEENRRDGKLWYDLRDEFGVVWSMPADQMLYMDITHHPLADATTADLDRYPWPNGKDPTRFSGVRAQALDAAALIVTDDHFGAAAPLIEPTRARLQEQVAPLLARGTLPVITGYVGATEAGVTTTLGRGGSDFSAAIAGAGLDATEVWIWSDVDGILTADPNLVAEAHTLSELSYSEAAELAYYGADVLHPKTIRPLFERGIPLRILNSFNPDHPGTLIVKSPHPGRVVKPAMISTTGLSLVAIGSRDDSWAPQHAAAALQALGDSGVEAPLFSQSLADHSLNLVVREQDQAHCLALLKKKFPNGSYTLGVKEKVAIVSVVGFPGADSDGQVVSQAFLALGRLGTRIIAVAQAGAGMGQGISFCIPQDQLAGAVRFLHRELGLEDELI